MARRSSASKSPKQVEALVHDEATRRNIPTAELQSLAERAEEEKPLEPTHYTRQRPLAEGEARDRDPDLDPQIVWNGVRIRLTPDQVKRLQEEGEVEIGDAQLVWRGKDRQDWSDLVVQAPPLYIQEKVHPKAIIDDLVRRSKENAAASDDAPDLFGDFNGLDPEQKLEFYSHDQHWSNRMILGDSLLVMASLAEREGLRGKVQCIYIDPPYGIKFNSNWQVSTASRDVKDGKQTDISREPEQVKAFRDTWKDGIHSYLTYLRDRLTVARELLTESGSVFVQIGDENVHRVRAVMDEVFGAEGFISEITATKTGGQTAEFIAGVADYVLWYARNKTELKFRRPLFLKEYGGEAADKYRLAELSTGERIPAAKVSDSLLSSPDTRIFRKDTITSQRPPGNFPVSFRGRSITPRTNYWKTHLAGMKRLAYANRLDREGQGLAYIRYLADFPAFERGNVWTDIGGVQSRSDPKIYVVQSNTVLVQRCLLMATDPGDLVLDPTCGSGTTATVAEQWGRRWITIDTSRVALALARARIMGARYPYYLLADTPDGRRKEGEVTGKPPSDALTHGDLRQGFVYERAPHITLKSIANNAEIDVIWESYQEKLEPLRTELNEALSRVPRPEGGEGERPPAGQAAPAEASAKPTAASEYEWEEWEIPREAGDDWPEPAKAAHAGWWRLRIARQKEIDDSIAKAADVELLYDRPYEDKNRVRVAGPFTVESLSPHRVVPADEAELLHDVEAAEGKRARSKAVSPKTDFAELVLEHLRTAGIQQSEKGGAIHFNALQPWPGNYVGAEGTFTEGGTERRAAIFIGPELGTVTRADLVAAAREASDARFDVLIACAFSFDAHSSELTKLGPLSILRARMNPDLHMAEDLKNTGKGNLFVVFGEPDIDIHDDGDGTISVEVKGVDVFDPNTGDIRSSDTESIAAWFVDTDYDEENFFVRHAYFLGGKGGKGVPDNDPYKALKTSLKAEIDEDAWATLHRARSRPFARPATRRIAVKVINHFGDEVMKVFGV